MLAMHLLTWFKGKLVGKDAYGNRYYRERFLLPFFATSRRRWVLYQGRAEGSKVPPEWHGWLHHTTDRFPVEDQSFSYEWQHPYEPNLTGTPDAYRPHKLARSLRSSQKPVKDYSPWTPN